MIFIYNLLSKTHLIFFFKKLSSFHNNFDKETSIVIQRAKYHIYLRFLHWLLNNSLPVLKLYHIITQSP